MTDTHTSVMVGGTLSGVTPAAGTELTRIGVPDSGYWSLTIWVGVFGAADAPNKVSADIPNRGEIILPIGGNVGVAPNPITLARLYLAVTQTVRVFLNAAGVLNSQYAAWLLLNPLPE